MSKQQSQTLPSLKSLHGNLLSKLQTLNQLNQDYKSKQQRQFINTFLTVMDQMSNQLVNAKQQYQEIDKEIDRQQLCQQFSKKLNFFKTQSFSLRQKLQQIQMQLQHEKNKQNLLLRDKKELEINLFKKSKDVLKYKNKIQRLIKTQKNQNFQQFQKSQQIQSNRKTFMLKTPKKYSLSETKIHKSNDKFYFHQNLNPYPSNFQSVPSQDLSIKLNSLKINKDSKMAIKRNNYANNNKIQWSVDKNKN